MMRFSKYASIVLVLLCAACSNPYKHLQQQTTATQPSAFRYQPTFSKELYRCVVDGRFLFKKFHLSGLLFFKTFDDSSTRAVFQNEMGFTFFDFKWDARDAFQVVSIIPQLDKPALVKILEKDMNLVLMKGLHRTTEVSFTKDDELFQRFTLDKGYAYYISREDSLERIENAGNSKVITITMSGNRETGKLPEQLFFQHHKAHFTIQLKKLIQDAE